MFKTCCCKNGHRVSSHFFKNSSSQIIALIKEKFSTYCSIPDLLASNAVCLDCKAVVSYTHKIEKSLADDIRNIIWALSNHIQDLEEKNRELLSEIAELKATPTNKPRGKK